MSSWGYVYILASRRHGTLYIGCTSDLPKRVYEHREGLAEGFTREHEVKRLVYFEAHDEIEGAILRERQMKEWRRAWKIQLVEKDNPFWDDLAVSLVGFEPLVTPAFAGMTARQQARMSPQTAARSKGSSGNCPGAAESVASRAGSGCRRSGSKATLSQ